MTIYHKHHIIPRHMGGTDDPDNIIKLTVEEHALAHKKLYEQYGKIEDKLAWQGLAGIVGKEEIIYTLMSVNNTGENNPMFGKSAIKENNLKWYTNGEENVYLPSGTQPDGYKNGRSNLKRRPASAETKEKISNSLKGNIPPNRIKVLSPNGEEFPSIKSAAKSLNMTVSKFRWMVEKTPDSGWIIQK